MKRIQLLIVAVSCIVFATSCSSVQGNKDEAYTPTPPPTTAVRGGDGELIPVAGKQQEIPIKNLASVGEEVAIKYGENVRLSFDGFDPDSAVILTVFDAETKTATMRIVDRSSLVVRFTKKCQTFRVGNVTQHPSFEVDESLPAEQIIISPLCDGQQVIIGYEYRYGSKEHGCKIAKDYLSCSDPKPTRRGQRVSNEQAMCIYFGICE